MLADCLRYAILTASHNYLIDCNVILLNSDTDRRYQSQTRCPKSITRGRLCFSPCFLWHVRKRNAPIWPYWWGECQWNVPCLGFLCWARDQEACLREHVQCRLWGKRDCQWQWKLALLPAQRSCWSIQPQQMCCWTVGSKEQRAAFQVSKRLYR